MAKRPELSVTPFLLAAAFLFLQHLIDLRDPKLLHAARTSRELELPFPRAYPPGPGFPGLTGPAGAEGSTAAEAPPR
jgi:hypothetical protein